jgi:ATP-dependent DNA helicase RecQ
MLACEADRVVLENFTFGDTPEPEAIAGLIDHLFSLGETFDISPYELSGRFDIRPLVLETVLAYLELDGVLSATGPFYNEYKFQPLRPSVEILTKFDAERAAFLRKLLSRAVLLKTWYTIDLPAAVQALKEPRGRLVAALNYLEEQGDLKLEVSGARLGFRLLTNPVREPLLTKLAGRFAQREQRDAQRCRQVLEFACLDGCRTRYLGQYFGEAASEPCGHCGWCLGERVESLPAAPQRDLGGPETALLKGLLARRHEALATPRQLTRFLCGLASPATSRAKLTKDLAFGALANLSFQTVLKWVEGQQ